MDCFHLMAIGNNDAVNMRVQVSLQDLVFHFIEYRSRSVSLDHMGMNAMRNFLRNQSQQLHHFIFPKTGHKGSSFSTFSSTLAIFWGLSFDSNHFHECEVVSHCGFDFFSRSQGRQWHPTPGLFPDKSHGRRSLVGCSPWGR